MSNDNSPKINTVDQAEAKKANRPSRPKGKGSRQQKGGVDSKSLFGRGSFASINVDASGISVVHRLPTDPKIKLEERISLGGVSLDPQVLALVKALNQMLRPGFDPNRRVPVRKDGKAQLDEDGKPMFNPSVADILIERLSNPQWNETHDEVRPTIDRGPSFE